MFAFAIAQKEDRLAPAKRVFARVLIHCPKDKDGFWMPHAVARMLDDRKNESILYSYRIALFNYRGVHFVDRTGEEDKALANKYKLMAEMAEDYGYLNLASELRSLAKTISGDWQRCVEEDCALSTYFDATSSERNQSRTLISEEADD